MEAVEVGLIADETAVPTEIESAEEEEVHSLLHFPNEEEEVVVVVV